MESAGRILNPRAIIKPSMSAEKAAPTQATPILDKFRALLRQREEEEGELRSDEVVRVYEAVLSELTFNSKPIITDLTIIAGEQRLHGEGIADAICARILEVPDDQKLPSLYLLDSIVKNIGREYVRYFSFRLPEVFCEAYRQVHPSLYPSMRHLFGTWSSVFPPSVLHKIESQLQFSSQPSNHSTAANSLRASESPRPTHGIHVNPKYLRQLEQPSPDNNVQRIGGSTSNLLSGQNPPTRFDEYDSGHTDPIPTAQVGTKRLKPMAGNSPGGLVEGTMHQVFNYGQNLGRATDRDDLSIQWKRRACTDDKQDQVGASIPRVIGNELDNQGPRALINAYGDDKRARFSSNKPWHTEILDVNVLGNRVAPGSWKNTEEEEFDWEDMSPTLVDGVSKSGLLPSSLPPFRRIGARPSMSTPIHSDPGIQRMRSSQVQIPRVDDSSNNVDDALVSGRGPLGLNIQVMAPRLPQERLDLPHRFPPLLDTRIRRDLQAPLSGVGLSSSPVDSLIPVVKSLEKDLQVVSLPSIAAVSSSTDSGTLQTWLGDAVSSLTGPWPPINVHKSYPPSAQPILPLQKQIGNQFGPLNASGSLTHQGLHRPLFTSERPLQSFDSKDNLQLLPNLNTATRPPFLSKVGRENFPSSGLPSVTLYPVPPPLNQTYNIQGPSAVVSMIPSYSVSSIPSLPVNNNPNILHQQLGARPPLPLGPPPRMIPANHNASQIVPNQSAGGAFSGLINSLMAQGLISLKNPASSQDPLGLEFDADLLKLRHESAISALYSELPRQCTTCGLRFKCQEQHSSHMDWHVTKNRMSRNRKQKPSRKWFVSASMWLSGAEALGTDSVPGFLPIETAVEKKDDEELAVPADEEQTTCALCGESFDDFYSDETEEWMYRGAVYLNAPKGSYVGMDKSQLGPIVHAKCRSETDAVP